MTSKAEKAFSEITQTITKASGSHFVKFRVISWILSLPLSSTDFARGLFSVSVAFLIFACGLTTQASNSRSEEQNAPPVTTLQLGKPIERELAGEDKHDYQLTLAGGQFAEIVVQQRGIDIVVQLLGLDGKLVTDFDFARRNDGTENIRLVAESPGNYRLSVSAKYPQLPTGRYEIRFVELRQAEERDRWLHEALKQETTCRQLTNAGKYSEAIALCEKAVELQELRLGKEHPDIAFSLLSLSAIYYFKAEYSKAESLVSRGLNIVERNLEPEHWLRAILLYNLALFTSSKGDKDAAALLYERALAIREKTLGSDHPLVAASLVDLGVVYRSKGDFVRAEQLIQRGMMVAQKAYGEESNNFASVLSSLASLYREKGDYVRAEPLYKRSLAIREKTNHPFIPMALNNLANLYRDLGDYDKAELLYLRSIAIKEKAVGPDHPDVADSRCQIAFLYYARANYVTSEELYKRALPTLEKSLGPNHVRVGLHLGHFGDVYFATGDYAKAEPIYLRALSSLETGIGPNYFNLPSILVNLAQISASQGKPDQAIAYQERANAIIEYNLALNLVTGSERQKLAYLTKLPEQINQAVSLHVAFADSNASARDLAATAILQSKGRVQDALSDSLVTLRTRFNERDQGLLDQLSNSSARLAQLVLNRPQGTSPTEHQKQIRTLEEEREKIESDISNRSAEFRSQVHPVTLDLVRQAIPEDAALVEFAVYRSLNRKPSNGSINPDDLRYVAYVIRRQGEVKWAELGPAKDVDDAIGRFRRALADPYSKDIRDQARAVDQKVMRPLRDLLAGTQHLLVSPDGQLNLIPFEALIDDRGRYLVEQYAFTYMTTGRDLLRMKVARDSRSKPIVVANPTFDATGNNQQVAKARGMRKAAALRNTRRRSLTTTRSMAEVYFAPLSGSGQEAIAIRKLLGADLLTGAGATESAVKEATSPSVLHFATHGYFLHDTEFPAAGGASGSVPISSIAIENPLLRSGLALAGANARASGRDDGILTALEASGLNLWGTKLVVLSACDTGLGEVRNGEGVYGLRRAFVLAGAESLLMTLWPVSDYATRRLMNGYYENLVTRKMGRGAALRKVQLDMIKDQRHPFYWANFIQSGEWANLAGQR